MAEDNYSSLSFELSFSESTVLDCADDNSNCGIVGGLAGCIFRDGGSN